MGLDLVLLRFFLILLLWPAVATSKLSVAKPNCQYKCGNITVPYPFGIGAKGCYKDESFQLTCNDSYKPPRLPWKSEYLEVLRVLLYVIEDCYKKSGQSTNSYSLSMRKTFETFTFSDTDDKFMALGCDTIAHIRSGTEAYIKGNDHGFFQSACRMMCNNISDVINNGSCSGVGCCETSIPKGFSSYIMKLESFNNHTRVFNFNPCSYAFIVDKNWYNFSVSDLLNFSWNVNEAGYSQVPVVLDWAVDNKTCEEAKKHLATYTCGKNSDCVESKNSVGYSCNYSQGYHGNPYLQNGCQG